MEEMLPIMWRRRIRSTHNNHVSEEKGGCLSQPHFEGSVRSPLTLSKMGLGSPPGLPKLQNLIARAKTPYIGVLIISLERS